jgi:hypothetical protein
MTGSVASAGHGRLAEVIALRGGKAAPEAPFVIEHREALIYMLYEAAELGLAHRPLQPQQQPVVVVHRVVDAVGVGQQRARQRAQLQQLLPVSARAGQPRHLDAQHQPHMPHGDLGDQPLEAHPAGRAGPGLRQVLVDH